MILTCPNCSAQFSINAELIGPAGRKVRCGSCGHTWRQLRTVENDAPPPPQGPPLQPPLQGPADDAFEIRNLRKRRAAAFRSGAPKRSNLSGRTLGWIGLGAVAFLLVGGLSLGRESIVSAVPELARFYEIFGVGGEIPGEGLALQEVTSVRRTFDGERRLIIEGVVTNVSEVDRPVPKLRASLHDANGAELTAWYFSADANNLASGARTTFSTLAQNPPDGATELTINFVDGVPNGQAQ